MYNEDISLHAISISLSQNGQIFVVSCAGSSGFEPMTCLIHAFKRQNKIHAITEKFTTEDPNADAYLKFLLMCILFRHNQFYDWLNKIICERCNDSEKAPPINTPTAISMTFPRSANA